VYRGLTNLSLALTSPRPSPLPLRERRGRNVRRVFEKPATGLAGRSSAKRKTCAGRSFSSGEKARMRAVVTHHFCKKPIKSRLLIRTDRKMAAQMGFRPHGRENGRTERYLIRTD
jgi:hypothetical protein